MENHELFWGLPVIGYLFLAGLGAGALVTSATLVLRGAQRQKYFSYARYGAILSVPTVAIGSGLLVLELGSFATGNWFRWINLYKTITLSPMSIGSWLLLIYLAIASAYTLLFLFPGTSPEDKYQGLRRKLAWACVPLGVAVAVYTGILLGAMPARPLWNSPVLALLFLISAISTGIAAVMLYGWVANFFKGRELTEAEHESEAETGYLLGATDTLLIGFEIMVIFLYFMYAHLSVGDKRAAISVFEPGGELFAWFFLGMLLFGLVVPGLIELKNILPRLLRRKKYRHAGAALFLVPVLVITGGFLLRYLIVVGGQISHLAGL
jgi:formate-dependent nitrite reductase membrane component NrfD